MIIITRLGKTYKTPQGPLCALRDIDLQVEKGDIYGIIGLSGAGKSTLIRCLNRLEEPDTGSIIIEGMEITRLGNAELREARKKDWHDISALQFAGCSDGARECCLSIGIVRLFQERH